ncbi:hypothetical protein [Mesorhizobium sp.]|uniref:hypothetical protein n=1 Tax=Mesorhizobium sp. TaxID=1871066 RepID=UPI000FE6AADA|nr:hypothetical protein [Mesorhizobium sp.]RWA98210.1 MAG: hypothetical protein EOQ33_28400 [Mesorhizobium sp.]
MRRIAVVVDGLDFVCKIEREFLKPILKGPDSLETAFTVRRSQMRLFDVRESKEQLTAKSATGALAYLKRGETVPYNNSADSLKGGIPAKRSQVKNRKPYWYSLQGEGPTATKRIVLPEHHDRRYVFTIIGADDSSVIIDTLYSFAPADESEAEFTHAGMNSLLGWYQVELRGRSQHGDGVLKVKLPDYRGVLLANPATVAAKEKAAVMTAFAQLSGSGSGPSLEELGTAQRLAFDLAYLRACGFANPDKMVVLLEQELRALAGERVERKLSVADAKISRRKTTNVAASVDAYAARIASALPPYPDPRAFINAGDEVLDIVITGPVDGPIAVGTELFDLGEVTAGGNLVARAGSVTAAQIVKAVLLIDPAVTMVKMPKGNRLQRMQYEWQAAVKRWQTEFESTAEKLLTGVTDLRTREAVINSAMALMHAK